MKSVVKVMFLMMIMVMVAAVIMLMTIMIWFSCINFSSKMSILSLKVFMTTTVVSKGPVNLSSFVSLSCLDVLINNFAFDNTKLKEG